MIGWRWEAVSFIGGHKDTLERVLGEMGCHPTKKAQIALMALPWRFLDWLAERDAGAAAPDKKPAQKTA